MFNKHLTFILLTTSLLRKLGACRPCTPRRVSPDAAVLYYFFLRYIHHGGVRFGKKIILIDKIGSAWSTLTLNHFLFSDYGLIHPGQYIPQIFVELFRLTS